MIQTFEEFGPEQAKFEEKLKNPKCEECERLKKEIEQLKKRLELYEGNI